MRGMREVGNALVVTIASVGLMLGALSISLVEFVPEATPTVTIQLFPSPLPVTATPTSLPTITQNPELSTSTSTPTNTVMPPVSCQPPIGWLPVTVQASDTLDSLAAKYRIAKTQLMNGNCLVTESLISGTVLFVPPAATSTVAICSKGAVGWVNTYIVKPGDTLYSIATNHYTTVNTLRNVNCKIGDRINVGEVLWIPNVATRTPFPTPLPGSTVTPQPTDPLTETALPFTATILPSETSTPTIQPSPTAIPTQTASPTAFPEP